MGQDGGWIDTCSSCGKSKSEYSEETPPQFANVDAVTLDAALIRQRVMNMKDFELYTLSNRIDDLIGVIPNLPLTEEQRYNAKRLVNGFRSIFEVRHQMK